MFGQSDFFQNDQRKIKIFDEKMEALLLKHLTKEDRIQLYRCVKKLPYKEIVSIINEEIKKKCIQKQFN